MILIVDTNVLISHAELDGGGWAAVRGSVAEGALTVVVPRVVVLELQEHVPARRRTATPKRPDWRKLNRAPERARNAIQKATDRINLEIEHWAASYDAPAVMEEAGFDIRPTPDVAHDEIVARATKRVRPFDETGGGYRDTLIWLTVLNVVRNAPGEEIILLSADRSAFWQGEQLHPDLQEEVGQVLPEGSTFRVAEKLADIDVPSRFSGDEHPVELDDESLSRLIGVLFANGSVRAPDLWSSVPVLRDGGEPIDAEISDPHDAHLISATSRPLQSGGHHLKARVRVDANVVFDWEDWFGLEDDGARDALEIVVEYEQDGDTLRIDSDSVNVQLAAEDTARKDPSADGRDSYTAKLLLEARLRQLLEDIGGRPAASVASSAEAQLGKSFLKHVLARQGGRRLTIADAAERRAQNPNLFSYMLDRQREEDAAQSTWLRIARLKAADETSRGSTEADADDDPADRDQ